MAGTAARCLAGNGRLWSLIAGNSCFFIRPDAGFGKGRDVSLCRLDQASSSISALRVVLRALYGSFAPRK